MKVGMIFECGPDGADRKVCEHLARRLRTDIEVVSVTLDFKPKLLADYKPTTPFSRKRGRR